MATITIREVGTDKIQTAFNTFQRTLIPVTREMGMGALVKASKKSPGWLGGGSYVTPESGYIRTGNLGRSVEFEQSGLSSRISVEAYSEKGFKYSTIAIGDGNGDGQAPNFAAIGWILLRRAVDEQIEILTRASGPLEQAIGQQAKNSGL